MACRICITNRVYATIASDVEFAAILMFVAQPILLLFLDGISRAFRKKVDAELIEKAVRFAEEQRKLHPDAKLEGVFTSQKEADDFIINGGTADVIVSNFEQNVFLLFSGKREAAEAERVARKMNAPTDMASLNEAINRLRPKR